MDTIDVMMHEHENILVLVDVIRSASCKVLDGEEIDLDDFTDMVNFAKNYADHHHHGKEEGILFREMLARLGNVAVNLVQHGMLVEHDMGRFHIGECLAGIERFKQTGNTSDKLDIVVNAVAWADLLKRHIDKENSVVYTFARRSFSDDIMDMMDKEVDQFNNQENEENLISDSLKTLERLSKKYC